MAANTTPIFIKAVRTEIAQHPSRTTPATDVMTGAADGSRVDSVTLEAPYGAPTTPNASIWQLILHDGTVDRIVAQGKIDAIAPTPTTAPWSETVTLGVFLKNASYKLKLNTPIAAGVDIDVTASGGDF